MIAEWGERQHASSHLSRPLGSTGFSVMCALSALVVLSCCNLTLRCAPLPVVRGLGGGRGCCRHGGALGLVILPRLRVGIGGRRCVRGGEHLIYECVRVAGDWVGWQAVSPGLAHYIYAQITYATHLLLLFPLRLPLHNEVLESGLLGSRLTCRSVRILRLRGNDMRLAVS